ncbi:MAG: GNAT family N-acetyltransferase [Butyrivibrio sp.]|nr:GNAT family N-acetyltransferase [Butyrivibrio sp.]
MHRSYVNDDITVFWDSDRCFHAKKCIHGAPSVFDRNKRPWIDVNAAPNPRIWQAVSQCPSGALSCVYNHGIRIDFNESECRSIAYDGDAEIGECCYRAADDTWTIVHTGVSPAYGGKGIAKRLVFRVTEEAERRKKQLVPVCSYAAKVLAPRDSDMSN